MEKDRVRFPGVGAPKQDHIGIFGFAIRTGTATRSKDRRQTGDAGGVSSSVTAIDIVCPHHGADKFLCRIVQLICGLGAAEHAEISRIVPGNGFFKCRSHPIHRFIPCGRAVRTVLAHQRLGKTRFHELRHKPPKEYKKIVAPFRPESTCLGLMEPV